ncbi:SDR family NAD(P)-dependent oxidoreductase [Gilvibacter sediminis]|uniref:SDR family NAD(P)-dependent oxidoreductase n=1 Tax=Gilvibacter sediminis TaxID=379071 RepID=UPI0023504480|nr:SDR family oxidoreductase [Gilvibacter sediminis]MDC7997575.1 SDR family oxidoreductase [Gilvibacter sediminis]
MGKNIIITGTSRGIGLELVKQFTADGHRVFALSRNDAPTASIIGCSSISCDLTIEDQIQTSVAQILSEVDQIDILINNSGLLVNKPFGELTAIDWLQSYSVNVFGVALLTQAVLPAMPKDGHVVNVSSMGGIMGSAKFPGLTAYSSSKGALITMTEVLAEEFKESGPSFNVLALGAVQTEMLEAAFPGYQAPITAAQMADYIKTFALSGNTMYNGKVLPVSSSTP